MKLKKITISNFKSIQDIEFDIKKYGPSYTTMLLGINESGKSNILEAMSYLETPDQEFDYYAIHNQKDDENNDVNVKFDLEFIDKDTCLEELGGRIRGVENVYFEINNIRKIVYLSHGQTTFRDIYVFTISKLSKGLYIKKFEERTSVQGRPVSSEVIEISKEKIDDSFIELTEDILEDYLKADIKNIIRAYEPSVTSWTPSPEYLISTEDLHEFKSQNYSKSSLKNLFILAGYRTLKNISSAIEGVQQGQQRSRLQSKLEGALNKYIKDVWKHDIDVVIDITETGKLTLSIRDTGDENMHDRLPIDGRSEGARHFLSLILSLSIESMNQQRENQLIIIDEPETHLHPSGIRDLRKELLKIGRNNYLFISTHSPFLVDRENKDRNIIIKKNSSALTEKIIINSETNVIDDEVLREAFGLEVYKDLLNPHSILVEGASDKIIIDKALKAIKHDNYGITNGHGSNIDTLAAKLNDIDISLLVIVDDDEDGRLYKKKIIRTGGSYSAKNVMTLRDHVGHLPEYSTIEDLLGEQYVEAIFKTAYKEFYNVQQCELELDPDKPFVMQMKAYLRSKELDGMDRFIETVKDKLASEMNLPKTTQTFKKNFPLLKDLCESIVSKLTSSR